MAMVQRIDRGNLQPPIRLPDGRIRVDAHITRTGVFHYALPDGTTRREYRPPEEVFNQDSLATFSMIPVTDDHPPVMLSSSNAKTYTVGVTGEQARADGDYVRLPLMILDASTIKKLDAGKIQVSAGYDCTCDETPGVSPGGERYDAIQRNIVANHVAIVMQGRAGAGAAIRMDGVGIQLEEPPAHGALSELVTTKEKVMELKEALEQAAKANARADAADAKALAVGQELAKLNTEFEKLKGERDALSAQATKADQERKDALDSVEPRIRARIALESQAAPFLKGVDLSKMDDRALKVAVIKHLDNAEVEASKSDAYVDGRFDASVLRASVAAKALGEVRANGEKARMDSDVDPEHAARAEMVKRSRDAHKANMERN